MARVISAGIQSIIEDLYGRTGYKDVGISHSGFMDHYTARLLNKVLGNDLNEAGIEIAGGGFALEFEEESIIAYGGSTIEGYVMIHRFRRMRQFTSKLEIFSKQERCFL